MSNQQKISSSEMKQNAYMFDIIAPVLLEFVHLHNKMDPNVLYKDKYELTCPEELILNPLQDGGPYIGIRLEISKEKGTLPETFVDTECCNDVLENLQYHINNVYDSIVYNRINDEFLKKVLDESIHFVYDAEKMSFKCKYMLPERRRQILLSAALEQILKLKEAKFTDMTDKEKLDLNNKYNTIYDALKKIQFDEEIATKIEDVTNKLLDGGMHIRLIYRTLEEDALPIYLRCLI